MGGTTSQSLVTNRYNILYGILALSSYYWFRPVTRYISSHIVILSKEYSKLHRPKRLILIRHGQSEANVDEKVYTHTPDHKISLTQLGKDQAEEASIKLKEIINNGTVKFYVSPYLRGQQTFEIIKSKFDPHKIRFVVDPRLREQEFGNLRDKNPEVVKASFEQSRKFGKYFYRFTNGESGADVYDRCTLFLDTLVREIDHPNKNLPDNIVIVCHGLFMRLFVMRYFKFSIDKFDALANPQNCEIWVMEKNSKGAYELISDLRVETEGLD